MPSAKRETGSEAKRSEAKLNGQTPVTQSDAHSLALHTLAYADPPPPSYWPFGDPFVHKRKLAAQKNKKTSRMQADEDDW